MLKPGKRRAHRRTRSASPPLAAEFGGLGGGGHRDRPSRPRAKAAAAAAAGAGAGAFPLHARCGSGAGEGLLSASAAARLEGVRTRLLEELGRGGGEAECSAVLAAYNAEVLQLRHELPPMLPVSAPHCAAEQGWADVLGLLVRRGGGGGGGGGAATVDVHARDRDGHRRRTVVMCAAARRSGDDALVRAVCGSPSFDAARASTETDSVGYTALMYAASAAATDAEAAGLEYLAGPAGVRVPARGAVNAGAPAPRGSHASRTRREMVGAAAGPAAAQVPGPLFYCRTPRAVAALVAAGADPNEAFYPPPADGPGGGAEALALGPVEPGTTPLLALLERDAPLPAVAALLKAGADPNLGYETRGGAFSSVVKAVTPASACYGRGSPDALRLLCAHGLDLGAVDGNGFSLADKAPGREFGAVLADARRDRYAALLTGLRPPAGCAASRPLEAFGTDGLYDRNLVLLVFSFLEPGHEIRRRLSMSEDTAQLLEYLARAGPSNFFGGGGCGEGSGEACAGGGAAWTAAPAVPLVPDAAATAAAGHDDEKAPEQLNTPLLKSVSVGSLLHGRRRFDVLSVDGGENDEDEREAREAARSVRSWRSRSRSSNSSVMSLRMDDGADVVSEGGRSAGEGEMTFVRDLDGARAAPDEDVLSYASAVSFASDEQ